MNFKPMFFCPGLRLCAGAGTLLMAAAAPAHAAEGFAVRHALRSGLGNTLFAEPQPGFAAGLGLAHFDIRSVVGADGRTLQRMTQPGVVTLPVPVPAAAYPRYGSQPATLQASGSASAAMVSLTYITEPRFAGGHLQFQVGIPYVRRKQRVTGSVATPALQWPSATLPPAAVRAQATRNFQQQFQAGAAAMFDAESGTSSGLGNIELSTSWLRTAGPWRVQADMAVVLPTASGGSRASSLMDTGKFYTFRPSVQAAYLISPDFGVSGRLSAGINTRNRDNHIRSGAWVGAEAGAHYKSPIGVFGLQVAHFQQVQDDRNNSWGAGRYRSTHAGVSYSTRIEPLDAGLRIAYMANINARNAAKANMMQVQFNKRF